ncbi:RrF2 family transcriptional regulator [Filifactor villosus]|uniref:RrF2 family transcriptional regulator n=1 Tax=Filifactor villosus TaxID=29374 RepID=A0ABV9QM11_9FIRM
MQLNITTDYAIRIMVHLAKTGDIVSSRELSEATNVTPSYVLKIMRKLVGHGLVSQFRGATGGFSIKKEAKDISLLEIISLMEGTIKLNRCLEDDLYCNNGRSPQCAVHQLYKGLQAILEEKLASTSLQDVLDGTI